MIRDPFHSGDPLDLVLHALANPLRRSLVERLVDEDVTVGDLAAEAGVSMPSISRHLRVLERAGLIVRMKQGRNHLITMRSGPLAHALAWFNDVTGTITTPDREEVRVPDEGDVVPPPLTDPVPASSKQDEPDQLDLSPDSLSDLVKKLKRG